MPTKKNKEEEDIRDSEEEQEVPTEEQEIEEDEEQKEEEGQQDIKLEKLKEGILYYIDPKKLKPHPKNVEIYGDEDVDKDLVASIKEAGQLEPIIITDEYLIISGHRRWRAICKIKDEKATEDEEEAEEVTAICFVAPFTTELEIMEAIIESNRQRKKLPIQIYKEAKLLDEIYIERARRRQLNSLKKGPVGPDPERRESDNGRTLEKEALDTGTTKGELYVYKRIFDRMDREAIKIGNELNKGEISYTAALEKLKLSDIAKDANRSEKERNKARFLVKQIENGRISINKAAEEFNKFLKNLKDEIPKTKAVLPQGVYNVIVADPTNIDEARALKIEARDAALFLWATPQNMKERIELMEHWGFNLKTIAVWNMKNDSWIWFYGTLGYLLFGIKGTMPMPDNYLPNDPTKVYDKGVFYNTIFKEGRINHGVDKSDMVYEMAERMFPGEKYCDPFRRNERDNWMQPNMVTVEDEDEDVDTLVDEDTNKATENNEQGNEVTVNNKKVIDEKDDPMAEWY